MSLLNGISSAGAGLASFGADALKDEQTKEIAASLLNNAPAPVAAATPAAPTTYGDPSLPGPRMPAGANPYGNNPHAQALWAAELAIKQPESGGKADAQNPVSSAGGLFQVTDGTFKGALEKMGLTVPASDAELKAMKYDPDMNTAVMRTINADAAAALASQGLPVTPQTLMAAHRLGPAGAVTAIKTAMQNPDAPLVGAGLPENAVRGNGDIANLSVGQFLARPYPHAGGA